MNQPLTLPSQEAAELIRKGEAPDGLRVQSYLVLHGQEEIRLPAGLQIERDFRLYDSSIEELPPGLKAFELHVDKADLKRLPHDLRVTTTICLKNCDQLATLPAGLQTNKLILDGCHALTTLSPLHITQEISVHDAPRLTTLPVGLKTGRLTLHECRALKILPEDLNVFFLTLSDCTAMDAYPERGPSTLGLFSMHGCTRLPDLPPWLEVVGQLDISDCPSITSIPAHLQVRTWIDIANTSLTSLPPTLKDVQLRWHGVPINGRIAFAPETFSVDEVIAEPNVELRRVIIERIGYQTFLRRAQAEVIDEDEDPGGQRQLLRRAIPGDEDLMVLSVKDPSIGRNYVLRVPPTMRSCHQAAAWIAGFENPDDYHPFMET